MSDVIRRIIELGHEAYARGLHPDRAEVSTADYAEVRRYVEERAGFTGEDVAAELSRHDPRSPYWGSPTRAERLRAAPVRLNLYGGGQVAIVEVPEMIGGPVLKTTAR